ncbi:MAG: hypothetical protein IJR70_05930 [Eubacterium sp.]|nr:hypothetical protein [Eubacterium sp.]
MTMKQQTRSKYDATPDNTSDRCYFCYYFCDGICTKDQTLVAISDPKNEYCGDFSYDYTAENAAKQKRSV